MNPLSQFLASAALAGAIVVPVAVQAAAHSLESQAKVSKPEAARTALAAVPDGKIREAELEREHGKLIWSFDIARNGSSAITEVHVDAISGAVISNTHESPAAEAGEAKAERVEAARDSKR